MSRADFELVKKVGDILKGMKTLDELVDEAPKVVLSDTALARWKELEKLYDDFYELSLDERIKYSGMNTAPNQPGEEEEEEEK